MNQKYIDFLLRNLYIYNHHGKYAKKQKMISSIKPFVFNTILVGYQEITKVRRYQD